jgi:KipI family sensor histidine kinase inhibitor
MSAATDSAVNADLSARITDYGDQALLLQFDSSTDVLACAAAVREAALPGVQDIVPASRTVLLKLDGSRWQSSVRNRLTKLRVSAGSVPASPPAGRVDLVIDVVYDGPDLDDVARHTGLTPAEAVDAHTATPWQVAFGGFAPGFAYLVGGDPRLAVPRRPDPRPSVPAGSVGLAGEFSGIYPRRSPGGWQLIGRTDAVMWDINRPDPALLTPGMWVQFRIAD